MSRVLESPIYYKNSLSFPCDHRFLTKFLTQRNTNYCQSRYQDSVLSLRDGNERRGRARMIEVCLFMFTYSSFGAITGMTRMSTHSGPHVALNSLRIHILQHGFILFSPPNPSLAILPFFQCIFNARMSTDLEGFGPTWTF